MSTSDSSAVVAQTWQQVATVWDFFISFVEMNRVSLRLHGAHREICDLYEKAILGEMAGYEYFVINMPRRTGKTKILEALPCWMQGEFPDAQLIHASYGDKLILRSMSYIGDTMQRPWYVDLYGDLIHTRRADLITTVNGGTIYGTGTSGTVTGFGAGLKHPAGGYIALDDPAKPDEALSKVESANVITNFETTFKGCRNSDQFCPIFVNAQRLGPDDLPGYLQKTYPNKTFTLKIPAARGRIAMFPETWSMQTLDDLEKTRIGRYVKASQFQQEPIALGGNLIMVESFRRFHLADMAGVEWDEIILTCDTAMKVKEANDYSCIQAWGKKTGHCYLLDQAWGKWESPELLKIAMVFSQKWRDSNPHAPIRFVIEEKAAGTGLLQQLQVANVPAEGIERDIDKVRRVQAVLPYQESGLVHIPFDDDAEWVPGFVMECAEFKPDLTHAHDDRVDCFADGVALLLGRPLSILDVLGAPVRR